MTECYLQLRSAEIKEDFDITANILGCCCSNACWPKYYQSFRSSIAKVPIRELEYGAELVSTQVEDVHFMIAGPET